MLHLDTSFLVDYEKEIAEDIEGPASRLLAARPGERFGVSIIALGEFAEGFSDSKQMAAFMKQFAILSFGRDIAYKGAALQRSLKGRRIGENDAWIAATALVYGAELVGRDDAFKRVPRLRYTQHAHPVKKNKNPP